MGHAITRLEDRFYELQRQHLTCPLDRECGEKCSYKMAVGVHEGCYHSPTSEYLGSEYSGIVVVGGNPAQPTDPSRDANVFRNIQSFLSDPGIETGRVMNRATEAFIPIYNVVRSKKFNYAAWGLPLKKLAYVNAYKCRTRGNYNAFAKKNLLKVCLERHLQKQMDLLRPRLIVYLWKGLFDAVVALGVDPAFGGKDTCFFNGQRNLPREPQHAAIREKVQAALGRT